MTIDDQLKLLDEMWDGPLFEIRGGAFTPDVYAAVLDTIAATELDGTARSLEIFRKLWYIPIFVMHNHERWKANGRQIDEQQFQAFLNALENLLLEKLGLGD